jgi:hypothetical protein
MTNKYFISHPCTDQICTCYHIGQEKEGDNLLLNNLNTVYYSTSATICIFFTFKFTITMLSHGSWNWLISFTIPTYSMIRKGYHCGQTILKDKALNK